MWCKKMPGITAGKEEEVVEVGEKVLEEERRYSTWKNTSINL